LTSAAGADLSGASRFTMTSQPPSLAVRVRLYLTLILQVLPFSILIVVLLGKFQLNVLLMMSPLLVAIVGLIMELASRPAGRSLTLIGLGVQALAVIAFLVFATLQTEDLWTDLTGRDALVLLATLLPLYLYTWNLLAGRKARA
jgi:hypothetical protein